MTDHQHPTAKPEGEGAGVCTTCNGTKKSPRYGPKGVIHMGPCASCAPPIDFSALLNPRAPVPALVGESVGFGVQDSDGTWSLYRADEERLARDDFNEHVVLHPLYLRPTPSADQSGVIGALTDLLSWFDSGPSQWGPWIIRAGEQGCDDAVEAARQALAAHAASIGGKS